MNNILQLEETIASRDVKGILNWENENSGKIANYNGFMIFNTTKERKYFIIGQTLADVGYVLDYFKKDYGKFVFFCITLNINKEVRYEGEYLIFNLIFDSPYEILEFYIKKTKANLKRKYMIGVNTKMEKTAWEIAKDIKKEMKFVNLLKPI